MVSKLKQRIADVVVPGWRDNKRLTSMLEHQERLRADPERQALNRRIDREMRKELAISFLVGGVALFGLMIGCVCWFAHVSPLTAIGFPFVQQLAATCAAIVVVAFLLLAR